MMAGNVLPRRKTDGDRMAPQGAGKKERSSQEEKERNAGLSHLSHILVGRQNTAAVEEHEILEDPRIYQSRCLITS
jgi:hypothetical protein